jgi:hypothetical protein
MVRCLPVVAEIELHAYGRLAHGIVFRYYLNMKIWFHQLPSAQIIKYSLLVLRIIYTYGTLTQGFVTRYSGGHGKYGQSLLALMAL